MKIKEGEKINKYLDLARELKKAVGIPIVVGALGTVPKCFRKMLVELEIGKRIKITQTFALSSVRKLKRVLETWRDLLLLRHQWKNSLVKAGVKKLARSEIKNLSHFFDLSCFSIRTAWFWKADWKVKILVNFIESGKKTLIFFHLFVFLYIYIYICVCVCVCVCVS